MLEDDATAALLALPPYGGLAEVSGPGAAAYRRPVARARVACTRRVVSKCVRASLTELMAALRGGDQAQPKRCASQCVSDEMCLGP